MELDKGIVTRIAGPVVFGTGFATNSKNVIVKIGEDQIIGEVVQIVDETMVIQAYEETEGIRVGDEISNTNEPLFAELGPGLLGKVIDGLQRPTESLHQSQGPFLQRGTLVSPFDSSTEWVFTPTVSEGDEIEAGHEFGYVIENTIRHPILLPPTAKQGIVVNIVPKGAYTPEDVLVELDTSESFGLHHKWQVRKPRPFRTRLEVTQPLITGQRVIDSFFPIAKGGSSIVSGGFGTGKTVLEQTIAKHARIEIIILILIGERGNEVSTALSEFAELEDKDGRLLLDRTIVIANTSNMPVAARESSVYLGLTIGEYYRDLGYNVAILADSMSRWAESIREISGRLEEMPAEEGYPSYMSKDLGQFFERAGSFRLLNDNSGTITFMAAISPPGGDFTEPVTQASLRVTGSFWALSTSLARSRHFPAIDWKESFSLYGPLVADAIMDEYHDWTEIRSRLLILLKKEEELEQSVRLLGRDSLSEHQKGILDFAKFIKRSFLQQDSFDPIDRDCSLEKQYLMMKVLDKIQKLMQLKISKGQSSEVFFQTNEMNSIRRMRNIPERELEQIREMISDLENRIRETK